MLPGVRSTILLPGSPVSVASNGVTVSVCSNAVIWLLKCHVILGTGAPTDLQEISLLSPSGMITVESLRAVVLASSINIADLYKTCY